MSSWKQNLFTLPNTLSRPQVNVNRSVSLKANNMTMAAATPGTNGPQGGKVVQPYIPSQSANLNGTGAQPA